MEADSLRYEQWIIEALRGVVVRALDHLVSHGLPGDHHYYITFRTGVDGVDLPDHLRAQYPDEMTIVLQHQFWDLEVDNDAFSVTLSFKGRSARLRVPIPAVTAFADPSVNFGLQLKADRVFKPTVSKKKDSKGGTKDAAPQNEPATSPRKKAASRAKKKGGEVIALDSFRKK